MNTETVSLSAPSARRDFWRRWGRLLLTVAGQNIIVYGVNLADQIMLGRLNGAETAISAVAFVNQIQFLLQMIINGVADGTVVICSRFWGEKNTDHIKKAGAAALRTGFLIAVFMLTAVQLFPQYILRVFTKDREIIAEAVGYIRIVSVTYVFFALTQVLLAVLRSVERAMIGFVDSCAALVVNIFLNYSLIFGHFGFPALGIRGAAVATLASRAVELLIAAGYLFFVDRRLRLKLRDLFRTDREITRRFFKVALPVMASGTSWGIAMSVQTAFLGHLEKYVVTANSISSILFQVVSVFIYGSATASSVMIGKTIGEGKDRPEELKREIRYRAGRMQIQFLILGVLTGLVLFCSRGLILRFYNLEPETVKTARLFMAVLSVTVVGTAYQMASLTGIVRGGGDTKFVFINDLIFMWGIILPTSYLAAFVFHFPPVVIFSCLKADQILKCFVAVVKVNRYKWMKKI